MIKFAIPFDREPALFYGFHTFRHNPQFQVAGHCRDGFHNAGITVRCGDIANKHPVDFECFDGESFQIMQGAITGPEVIDGEVEAGVARYGRSRADIRSATMPIIPEKA